MSSSPVLRTEDLSWRRVDDEVVVLDLRSSVYLSLNGSAAVLWEALAHGADEPGLGAALVETYDIPVEQARTDVAAFLADCRARDLVR